ncbi:hypothetical protein DVG80_18710 [Rhodococcus erythropolis]|nr:hypothetical protein DVG80_18710 [Rhodococcus erythropolis]
MNTVERFVVLVLSVAYGRLTPGTERIDTLAQWATDEMIVQAHRTIRRNNDGTFTEAVYTVEFVATEGDCTEVPSGKITELLTALTELNAVVEDQKALDTEAAE